MSANKPQAWTAPGPIDQAAQEAAEVRKGTAADRPVLSLGPDRPGSRRPAAAPSGDARQAPDTRSPAEIEADIELTRTRLAETLDELSERLSPRAALRKANETARGAFVTSDGSVRKDRAALVLGVLAVAIGATVALNLRRDRC